MLPLITVLVLLLALVTLLPLSRSAHWLVRGMDFPRLQIIALAAALLVAELVLLDVGDAWVLALVAITALCLAWHAAWILPYTPLWPHEVKAAENAGEDRQLCVLVSNVLTPNRGAHRLLELVSEHQPDVLVTLESDQWWQDQLEVLEARMPYSVKCPLDNLYGMHLYSRLPLDEQEVRYLVEDDVPSIHTTIELRSGDKVRAHFLHPAPPSPTENPESAERDAELIVVARGVADSEQPIIVTGDLNDVAWSATTRLFRKLSGLLDPRVGRGVFNTFHADYPFLRWPLDHLFHSRHFTVLDIRRLPSIGSDHFPLLARLVFTPEAHAPQEGLRAQPAAHERAREIVADQDVSKHDVPNPGEDGDP